MNQFFSADPVVRACLIIGWLGMLLLGCRIAAIKYEGRSGEGRVRQNQCLMSNVKLSQGALPRMKFGVIVFPGSNCDHDAYNVVSEIAKQPCSMIWHESENLENADAII